jgi:hypothetical protein
VRIGLGLGRGIRNKNLNASSVKRTRDTSVFLKSNFLKIPGLPPPNTPRPFSGFSESVPEKNGQTMSALIRIRAGLENIAVSKGHFRGVVPEFAEQAAISFQTPAGKPGEEPPVFVAAGEMVRLETEFFSPGQRPVLQGPVAIRDR